MFKKDKRSTKEKEKSFVIEGFSTTRRYTPSYRVMAIVEVTSMCHHSTEKLSSPAPVPNGTAYETPF